MIQFLNIFKRTSVDSRSLMLASMLIGSTQVIGRVLDLGPLRRFSVFQLILFSLFGMAFSLVLFGLGPQNSSAMLFVFTLAFGISNGLLTVTRSIYVFEQYDSILAPYALGWISSAGWVARALGPLFVTFAFDSSISNESIFSALAIFIALSLSLFLGSQKSLI